MSTDRKITKQILTTQEFPIVSPNDSLYSVLKLMSEFKIGHACLVDEQNKLIGVFTDGDFRRLILNIQKPLPAMLNDEITKYASKEPVYTFMNSEFTEVKDYMFQNQIWDLPVIDQDKTLIGLIHMSSLLR
jgi:arabinose-5-phosphate isomerase